jgi:hypothetical protein
MEDTTINLEEIGAINAQQQAKLYPDTFEALLQPQLDCIAKDDFVKVCVDGERFWILVESVKKNVIKGTVNNILLMSDEHSLYFGDTVQFSKKHVYSHLKAD